MCYRYVKSRNIDTHYFFKNKFNTTNIISPKKLLHPFTTGCNMLIICNICVKGYPSHIE